MLPYQFRRSSSITIALIDIIILLGIFKGSFGIDTNLAQTGVTLGLVLSALNGFLLYLIYYHQIP